jgi:hypothetical protein
MMRVVKTLLACTALTVAACGGGDGGDDVPDAAPEPTGMKTKYVSDSIKLPTSPTESQMYGIDLDDDPQNRPDNLLGSILATLASQDVDLQAQVDEGVTRGELVLLHEIQADDFITWPTGGWQVFLGSDFGVPSAANCDPAMGPVDNACPKFDGTDTFTVDPTGPTDAKMAGIIAGGRFVGGPAKVTLKLAITDTGDPLQLDLIGARIEADVTATGITNAKLGGAITKTDIDTQVIPNVATLVSSTIAEDPGCMMTPPMCGSSAQTLLDLFDHGVACTEETTADVCPAEAPDCDIPAGMTEGLCTCATAPDCAGNLAGDMQVTVAELVTDELISSILAPDVDLLNCGADAPQTCDTYAPRQDGVKDSVSMGVGFSGVNASF